MDKRRSAEIELVQRILGELKVGPNIDWLVIPKVALRPGWNKKWTRVLILIPAGYPTTPPDNFYADQDLRLTNSQLPGNTSEAEVPGLGFWLMFSHHLEAGEWQPHPDLAKGHNLLTYIEAIKNRLAEAS